jgi:hypothetical protein
MTLKQLIALVIRIDYEDRGMWRNPSIRPNQWDWKYWCTEKGSIDLLGLAAEVALHRTAYPRACRNRAWQTDDAFDALAAWNGPAYVWLMTDMWLEHSRMAWHYLQSHGINVNDTHSETRSALKLLRAEGQVASDLPKFSAPIFDLARRMKTLQDQGIALTWDESIPISKESWDLAVQVFTEPHQVDAPTP